MISLSVRTGRDGGVDILHLIGQEEEMDEKVSCICKGRRGWVN
jgi:hypothetical protein